MPKRFPVRSRQRAIHLLIDNEALRLFLAALLLEWQFQLQAEPHGAQLLLVEEGVPLPPGDWPLLTLSRSPGAAGNRLALPMSMEQLWINLEGHFHRPPRIRLRIELDLETQIEARGDLLTTRMESLSDLGGRFPLPRELAGGEVVHLCFHLHQHGFHLPGRVIYSVSSSDFDPCPSYDTGVIFEHLDPSRQNLLREYMILSFLERLQPRLPGWAFQVGLSFFDIPAGVLQGL